MQSHCAPFIMGILQRYNRLLAVLRLEWQAFACDSHVCGCLEPHQGIVRCRLLNSLWSFPGNGLSDHNVGITSPPTRDVIQKPFCEGTAFVAAETNAVWRRRAVASLDSSLVLALLAGCLSQSDLCRLVALKSTSALLLLSPVFSPRETAPATSMRKPRWC